MCCATLLAATSNSIVLAPYAGCKTAGPCTASCCKHQHFCAAVKVLSVRQSHDDACMLVHPTDTLSWLQASGDAVLLRCAHAQHSAQPACHIMLAAAVTVLCAVQGMLKSSILLNMLATWCLRQQ